MIYDGGVGDCHDSGLLIWDHANNGCCVVVTGLLYGGGVVKRVVVV